MSYRYQNKPRVALRESITGERAPHAKQCRDARMLLRAAAELLTTDAIPDDAHEPLGDAIGSASHLLAKPGKHAARAMNAAVRRLLAVL